MNTLNSVLIEATLTADPTLWRQGDGPAECTFTILSTGYRQTANGKKKEVLVVAVETWDALAERWGNVLTKGRVVRIVGKLVKRGDAIRILAEHIELRPERSPK